jgi:hypothetical protein
MHQPSSLFLKMAPKMFVSSCDSKKALSHCLGVWTVFGVQQTEPKAAFLGLLATDFDSHQKVLFAECLVGLDVVCTNGA